MMSSGEAKAWEILKSLDTGDVCRRSGATFDAAENNYILRSFGKDFRLAPENRKISGDDLFLKRLGYFFGLSALCYLNSAKDIAPSGRLIRPSDLKGGQLFFKGSHMLPLDRIAAKYDSDIEAFLNKGAELGAEQVKYGDAALKFLPFPKITMYVILWRSDEEFAARADLLLDSTCEMQAPLDIIWSIAMMTVLAMM